MATKQPVKAVPDARPIPDMDLFDYGSTGMMIYGTETNENRAIPNLQDGLKTVARRLLWAGKGMSKQGKSARLVGSCLGGYHPHGDSSIYGGLVTMVNAPTPMFRGIGNWGDPVSPAAAARYTEVKLGAYGAQFLVHDYLAVTPMTPNYDDKTVEPIFLPALLPNIILNDSDGIGVACATTIPSFTPTSVLEVLIRMIDKEAMEPEDFAKALEFYEPWGGVVVKSKANREQRVLLMQEPKARIEWESPVVINRDAKRIIINKFPPSFGQKAHDTLVEQIRLIPQVASVGGGRGLSYEVRVKASVNFNEFDQVCAKVQELTRTKVSYNIFMTERTPIEDSDSGEYEVSYLQCSIPQLLLRWLKWRIKLEFKCLEYRLQQTEILIERLALMVYACDHLDVIFKALRTTTPAENIAKGLKITLEQANLILDLKVRRLSALDQNLLKEQLERVKKRKALLETQLKRPAQNVKRYFQACLELFAQKERMEGTGCWQWWLKSLPPTDDTKELLRGTGDEDERDET